MANVPSDGLLSALWHDIRSVVTGVASAVIVWAIAGVRKAITKIVQTQRDHEERLSNLEREHERTQRKWEDRP